MDEIETLLSGYEPGIRELALELRKVILDVIPDADETVHAGWRTISYGLRTQLCAIAPHKTRVNLTIHRGADMDDPHGLLEGTGKKMRHVKIASIGAARDERVAAIVRAAAALAS